MGQWNTVMGETLAHHAEDPVRVPIGAQYMTACVSSGDIPSALLKVA